jgi:steroid delta-isomerase-like uncharacterized protein
MKGTAMSIEENKAIALRFGQVWGKGDIGIVDELGAPGLRVSYPLMPAPTEGVAAFKEVLKMVHTAFPDVEIEIGEPIAEGNRVAVAWTMRGTHKGQMMGLPPTGKTVTWSGITLYRIENGKVVDERGEEDGLALMRQLGAIPG